MQILLNTTAQLEQLQEKTRTYSTAPTTSDGTCDINEASTTWVLISTILVLGMIPGLAFFEAGLLRTKNTVSLFSQTFSGLVVLSVLWELIGYSLVFGDDVGGIIGDATDFLLIKIPDCVTFAPHIPGNAHVAFMMMFAAITPLLITGAVAERLQFKCFIVFIIFWEIIVFYPLAHWIWGGGWMAVHWGVQDFAGGIVIHTSAGSCALVMAKMLGRRIGFEDVHGEFPPSNIPLAATGAGFLWIGWFGFNAGSALIANKVAASTVLSTQIAGSVSGLCWIFFAWMRGKPSSIMILNGVIAGLAGVTPASGYISSQSAMVLGFILGVCSYWSVHLFKHILHTDDALDVSSVHGLTGIIGSISIGFIADSNINPKSANGIIFGGDGKLLGYQTAAVCIAIVYSALVTFVIGKILDWTWGLRISKRDEVEGLDVVEHGEFPYHELLHPEQENLLDFLKNYRREPSRRQMKKIVSQPELGLPSLNVNERDDDLDVQEGLPSSLTPRGTSSTPGV